MLGGWHRAPFIYNVQELYPDIAINLGAVRNRTAIRLLFALERFVYARAARITLIAERMRRRLVEKGVPAARTVVIPNFVDMTLLRAVPSPNEFTREADIDGRFVICYAGNLGPAQGLDTLLDAARLVADEPAIVLVLVGGGTLWNHLGTRIREEQLSNVRLVAHQPFSRVPEIYGASHLSVVSQAAATGSDAVPSKVYRIMACGGAVLAATDAESDLAHLIAAGGCGFVVPQESPQAIASAIRDAFRHRESLAAMGASGRRHVIAHYARPVVTARYATGRRQSSKPKVQERLQAPTLPAPMLGWRSTRNGAWYLGLPLSFELWVLNFSRHDERSGGFGPPLFLYQLKVAISNCLARRWCRPSRCEPCRNSVR
jgi:colanic acid biosynthesis glycosyl transferase WcaI